LDNKGKFMKPSCVKYILALLLPVLLLTACSGVFDPPRESDQSKNGRVMVRIGDGASDSIRTVLPTVTPDFTAYDLVFARGSDTVSLSVTDADEVAALENGAGKEVALLLGDWTLTVTAYRNFTIGGETKSYKAASGIALITVREGAAAPATVYLSPIAPDAPGASAGIFTWQVSFPETAQGRLILKQGAVSVLDDIALTSGVSETMALSPGSYNLSIILTKGTLFTGEAASVQIYSGMESRAEFVFAEDDFKETVFIAGTAVINNASAVSVSAATITAYSDAERTIPIVNGSAAAVNDAWLITLPAAYINQNVYLTLEVIDTNEQTHHVTGESGTIPENGMRGITLSMALYGISVTANGSPTATTTKLTLTFDSDIDGLTEDDINITANDTGAIKGTLTKTGAGVYELTVSGITASGEITVDVVKAGYWFTSASKQVPVTEAADAMAAAVFTSNHSAALALTVSAVAITDEADVDDALLAYNGLSEAVQALVNSEKSLLDDLKAKIDELKIVAANEAAADAFTTTYSAVLALTVETVVITDEAAVDAALSAYDGLSTAVKALVSAEKSLLDDLKTKIAELRSVTFSNLTADGSSTAITTTLTLTFNKDITGLTDDDITLTANSTGTTAGTLTAKGSGKYELAVSGITANGEITVSVTKDGYTITPDSQQVTVYGNGSAGITVIFSNLPVDETFDGFSGASSELSWKADTTLTMSVPAGSFAEYTWYLDNNLISGATSASLTMTARNFEIGSHTVTLKVKASDDKYYSKTVKFTVISGL
jgi:hypothetical protein